MRNYKFPLLLLSTSFIVGILPLLSVLISGFIAHLGGCNIHEGFATVCNIGPFEVGQLLTNMVVAGWLMFVSLPLGMLGLKIGLIWLIIQIARNMSQQQAD